MSSFSTQQALKIARVEPRAVFNLSLFEGYVVIDTRSPDVFASGHIASAVNTETNSTLLSPCQLDELCRKLVDQGPDRYSPVVLYGDDSSESNERTNQLVAVLQSFVAAAKPAQPEDSASFYDHRDEHAGLKRFMASVRDRTRQVWIIDGGYQAFASDFPLLCGDDSRCLTTLGPQPSCITPYLFLGSRVFETSEENLLRWGIKHVVTHVRSRSFFGHVCEPEIVDGVRYLRCNVPDVSEVDMAPCFNAAIHFISEARAKGERVLVLLHGRSRSAGVVAAWLMYSEGWSAQDAMHYVLSSCSSIDASLMYGTQLQRFQPRGIIPALTAHRD